MNDEHRRIIIKRISSYEQQGGAEGGAGDGGDGAPRVTPINRWVALIVMIPILALLAVLGVFFFTIFVALFSIIALVFGVRIWWLRRKFRQTMQASGAAQDERYYGYTASEEKHDQYGKSESVEDAVIIEETEINDAKKTASKETSENAPNRER